MTSDSKCVFCSPSSEHAPRAYLESPRWRLLRHADPVPIAGWMMIATRAHRAGLDEMDAEEQRELGQILARVAGAVRAVTGCERTYAITFNEAVKHLHMHVIPRHASDVSTTSWALADRYRSTMRGEMDAATPQVAEQVAQQIAALAAVSLGEFGFAPPEANR